MMEDQDDERILNYEIEKIFRIFRYVFKVFGRSIRNVLFILYVIDDYWNSKRRIYGQSCLKYNVFFWEVGSVLEMFERRLNECFTVMGKDLISIVLIELYYFQIFFLIVIF